MYYLYILKSQKDLGYYIGITRNIEERLKEHNQGKTKSTKGRLPLILAYFEKYENKSKARMRELKLKNNYQVRKKLLNKMNFNIK
jgi:putative endonuclease